jgi:surface protein
MFHGCSSVIEINLGKLDFSLSERFYGMFRDCFNLEKLDVSNLNTENSKSFSKMFLGCYKLKEINVSKFKTNKCKDIRQMFQDCKSIEYIDMLNWDMSNIDNHYGISGLFYNCSSLKNIKMNFNKENYFERAIKKDKNEYIKICFKNDVDINKVKEKSLENEYIFKGLPKYGSFIFRKGVNCYKLLKLLPSSWNYSSE